MAKSMAKYGMILYALGICVAVIGAAKMPETGQTWSNTLYVFNDGIILTLLGLVLWRFGVSQDSSTTSEDKGTVVQLLKDMEPILEDLYREVDDLSCAQIAEYLMILKKQYLLKLENRRNQVINKFGLEKSADLLIAISYGERVLNRAHSAALDDHHDESVECVEEAYNAFKDVFVLSKQLWKYKVDL